MKKRIGFLYGNYTDSPSSVFYRPPVAGSKYSHSPDVTWDDMDELKTVIDDVLSLLSSQGTSKFRLKCLGLHQATPGLRFYQTKDGSAALHLILSSSNYWRASSRWRLAFKPIFGTRLKIPILFRKFDIRPRPLSTLFTKTYRRYSPYGSEEKHVDYFVQPAYWHLVYKSSTPRGSILQCILNFQQDFLANFDWLNNAPHPSEAEWVRTPTKIEDQRLLGTTLTFDSRN